MRDLTKFMADNSIKDQILRLVVVCFLGLLIGYAMMKFVHWRIETSPDSACGLLKESFKNNDSFVFKSCKLREEDGKSGVVLSLRVKDEMEQYFDQHMENITNENITDSQIDFYCAEFFDLTRADSLNLIITGKSGELQQVDVTRDICL